MLFSFLNVTLLFSVFFFRLEKQFLGIIKFFLIKKNYEFRNTFQNCFFVKRLIVCKLRLYIRMFQMKTLQSSPSTKEGRLDAVLSSSTTDNRLIKPMSFFTSDSAFSVRAELFSKIDFVWFYMLVWASQL